ncbi:MAG TPA: CRISPR-associated endonuclease Cas2 [Fimbriiglobus sp.]|jgi:CRISPR-associated protein Cas2
MKVLVAYDVCTVDKAGEKRLRRVARACKNFGVRVQKSLFECTVGSTEWVQLRGRLMTEMDATKDSIRCYFLEADVRVEHHGAGEPPDLEGPLVI